MNTLTRFNPFKQIANVDNLGDIGDLVRGFGLRSMLRDFDAPLDLRMDVTDNDTAYLVKLDLPGVAKSDIDVSIEGNRVTINAEVKRETSKKHGKELHTERYCGTAFRSFTLPQDIDRAKAQASYDNGVLALTLPKKPNGNSRKITIS